MSIGFKHLVRAARPIVLGRAAAGRKTHHGAWRAMVLAMLALLVASARPANCAAGPMDASTGRAAREDAIRSIPYDRLDANEKSVVSSVVSHASIFRRLPVQVIDCDPDMHLFLIRHPEVIVNIWSVMGVSKVSLERTGPETFSASDGAGTVGRIRYCYTSHDTQVIYADGTYDGPVFSKPVQARCVLVLKSGGLQETNGRYYITNRLDAFIQIDNVGLELIAKTFQPLVNKSADYNFIETCAFLANVSRTAETNTPGMLKLSAKLSRIDPAVRDRFAALTANVGQKATGAGTLQPPARQPAAARPGIKTAAMRP